MSAGLRPKMVRGPELGSCGHPIEVGRTAARCLPCASQVRNSNHRIRNPRMHTRATMLAAASSQ